MALGTSSSGFLGSSYFPKRPVLLLEEYATNDFFSATRSVSSGV